MIVGEDHRLLQTLHCHIDEKHIDLLAYSGNLGTFYLSNEF